MIKITGNSNLRIGKNILMNRMGVLNNEIDFKWLKLTLTNFKLKCNPFFIKLLISNITGQNDKY